MYERIKFNNKRVSYPKQIVRQHSCTTKISDSAGGVVNPVKKFPLVKVDHHAELRSCFSYGMRACKRSQQFWGCWGFALRSTGGVADPLETLSPHTHTYYHADPSRPAFQGHSSSSEPTWIDRPPMTFYTNHGPMSYRFRIPR